METSSLGSRTSLLNSYNKMNNERTAEKDTARKKFIKNIESSVSPTDLLKVQPIDIENPETIETAKKVFVIYFTPK